MKCASYVGELPNSHGRTLTDKSYVLHGIPCKQMFSIAENIKDYRLKWSIITPNMSRCRKREPSGRCRHSTACLCYSTIGTSEAKNYKSFSPSRGLFFLLTRGGLIRVRISLRYLSPPILFGRLSSPDTIRCAIAKSGRVVNSVFAPNSSATSIFRI
jgi:hypothetical protein